MTNYVYSVYPVDISLLEYELTRRVGRAPSSIGVYDADRVFVEYNPPLAWPTEVMEVMSVIEDHTGIAPPPTPPADHVETSYQYVGNIDPVLLADDIVDETDITRDFLHINMAEGVFQILFESSLPPEQLAILDQIVANNILGAAERQDESLIKLTDLSTEVADFVMYGGLPYYKFAESNVVNSTTSNYWLNKVALSSDNLAEGTYKISWAYQWNTDDTAASLLTKVVLYGEGKEYVLFEHFQKPKDSGGTFQSTGSSQMHPASGFKTICLSGNYEIVLSYRSETQNKKVSIWGARMDIQKVSNEYTQQ